MADRDRDWELSTPDPRLTSRLRFRASAEIVDEDNRAIFVAYPYDIPADDYRPVFAGVGEVPGELPLR